MAVFVAASLAEITRYLLLPLFNVPETFHQSVLDVYKRQVVDYDVDRMQV